MSHSPRSEDTGPSYVGATLDDIIALSEHITSLRGTIMRLHRSLGQATDALDARLRRLEGANPMPMLLDLSTRLERLEMREYGPDE